MHITSIATQLRQEKLRIDIFTHDTEEFVNSLNSLQ